MKKANEYFKTAFENFNYSIEFFGELTDITTLIKIMQLEILCYRHEITAGIFDDEYDMQMLINEVRRNLKFIDAH